MPHWSLDIGDFFGQVSKCEHTEQGNYVKKLKEETKKRMFHIPNVNIIPHLSSSSSSEMGIGLEVSYTTATLASSAWGRS